MEMYKHILCATDFSKFSEAAMQRAADMARHYGAKLTLLHIIECFPEDRSNEEIAPEDVDPKTYREEQAKASLSESAQSIDYDNVGQVVRFSSKSAKHDIVDFAMEEQDIDLIVLSSHGHQGITPILGSTTYGVAHRAPCDVLVVRSR